VTISLPDVIESCRYLTFDPSDNNTDVANDDFGQDGSVDDHLTVDYPALDILVYATNCTDSDGIPPVQLACLHDAQGSPQSVRQIEAVTPRVHDGLTGVDDRQSTPLVDWYPTTLCKDEWDNLPHISPTSVADWYPTTLDKDEWDNLHHFSPTSAADRDPTTLGRELEDDDEWCNALTDETDSIHVNAGRHTQANEIDHVPTRPKCGWLSADIIRATFQSTTQYVRLSGSEFLKKHYKPPFHALTMFRSDAAFTKRLVHVLASSSFNLRLGLLDGASSYKLRLAPIDGEFLRQFVQFRKISPCELSPTDNIVQRY
jgi:hypothetical protein